MTSFDAQTNQDYNPGQGVNDRDGSVNVLHALIVSSSDGGGRLIAGLVNDDVEQEDALTGVEAAPEEDGKVTVTVGEGSTDIAADGILKLADTDAAVVYVEGEEVVPGQFIRVVFSFERADDVTLNVPVVEPGEDYAEVEVPSKAPSA